MIRIHNESGFFIAPAPMYESYKTVFHNALGNHDREILIPFKDGFRRGFEVPLPVSYEEKEYSFRMIILYDPGLYARESRTLKERIASSEAAFKEQAAKPDRYRLKTEAAIDKACAAILKKYQTAEFFEYTIISEPVVTWKNAKRGRPAEGKPVEKIPVTRNCFRTKPRSDKKAFEKALSRCGYYPLITDKPEEAFSVGEAMAAPKNLYKSEHTDRRARERIPS